MIVLQDSPPVILRDEHPAQAGNFAGLSCLLNSTERPEAVSGEANLIVEAPFQNGEKALNFRDVGLAVAYDRGKCLFRAAAGGEAGFSGVRLQAYRWQFFVLLAILSAMLRGSRVLPVHGALLSVRGGGLLFCGESGVGKSTTSRRWQAAGGGVAADDMLLLEYGKEQLSVHPLPTWSRCAVSAEGLCYPVNRVIPLVGVLGIARGEKQEVILPVSNAEFFTQLYSSSLFFIKSLISVFRGEERTILLNAVQNAVETVFGKFPPKALFAHLDGDLQKTLEDYL